mgnify:CR=1 FL=1
MADGYPQPVFLDATIVSNYASTDSIDFLVQLLESPVVVQSVKRSNMESTTVTSI